MLPNSFGKGLPTLKELVPVPVVHLKEWAGAQSSTIEGLLAERSKRECP